MTEMKGSAALSADGRYRWLLNRTWGDDRGRHAAFIMLNPSTADGTVDDPTIRKCIGYAKREGCESLTVANLYAYRATKPSALTEALAQGEDIVGDENNFALAATIDRVRFDGGIIVAAWGAERPRLEPLHSEQIEEVLQLTVKGRGNLTSVPLWCLHTTNGGQPGHPLYLSSDAPLVSWPPKEIP